MFGAVLACCKGEIFDLHRDFGHWQSSSIFSPVFYNSISIELDIVKRTSVTLIFLISREYRVPARSYCVLRCTISSCTSACRSCKIICHQDTFALMDIVRWTQRQDQSMLFSLLSTWKEHSWYPKFLLIRIDNSAFYEYLSLPYRLHTNTEIKLTRSIAALEQTIRSFSSLFSLLIPWCATMLSVEKKKPVPLFGLITKRRLLSCCCFLLLARFFHLLDTPYQIGNDGFIFRIDNFQTVGGYHWCFVRNRRSLCAIIRWRRSSSATYCSSTRSIGGFETAGECHLCSSGRHGSSQTQGNNRASRSEIRTRGLSGKQCWCDALR